MMERAAGIEHARMQALTLLDKFGVESLEHVRIDAFARRLGVELFETEMDGARAQLVVSDDGASILLPQDEPAEQRWSIAHELGHLVLKHPAPPAGELCRPRQCRRRRDRRHYEDEAEGFAAALLIPDSILAALCDVRPMTLDVPAQLAAICGVPWAAAAARLTEVTWRVCGAIVSQHGMIRGGWLSLPFMMLFPGRIFRAEPVNPGTLARRYFDTGEPCGPPALVPASAWLADVGPELQLQEHSVALPSEDAVVTMLWDPAESTVPRPPDATLRAMAICHDHLIGELQAYPSLARIKA
jgi:Zn-dependent peptidase ImmA (M78 family)